MNGLHGIIFSYESRNDLKELVEFRSSASVPFGGRYRMVDFALSNLVNAGVTDVGVVLHGRYQSMIDHLPCRLRSALPIPVPEFWRWCSFRRSGAEGHQIFPPAGSLPWP